MSEKEESKKTTPPYLPFKTLVNFIDSLKVGIPPRIDRSLMKSFSGGMQSQIMVTLEYLNLIEPKTGIVKENLKPFVNSEGVERHKILHNILTDSYPFLFIPEDVDLGRITEKQLREIFEKTGAAGDTLRKSITFFLKAAKSAGIKISPHLKTTRGPRVGSKRKKTNTAQGKTGNGESQDKTVTFPQQDHGEKTIDKIMLEKLLEKYPPFNPEWPEGVQLKWFEGWDKLTERLKK